MMFSEQAPTSDFRICQGEGDHIQGEEIHLGTSWVEDHAGRRLAQPKDEQGDPEPSLREDPHHTVQWGGCAR